MLNVIMLSVVILGVVAPFGGIQSSIKNGAKNENLQIQTKNKQGVKNESLGPLS